METEKTIYTHDEAAKILDRFERVLCEYNISVPSPEDEDRDEDDTLGLYGSTYSDLLDDVENTIIEIIERVKGGEEVIEDTFSGNW